MDENIFILFQILIISSEIFFAKIYFQFEMYYMHNGLLYSNHMIIDYFLY